MTDLKLNKGLEQNFRKFCSEELAPFGSTQANEAINSIAESKAPKLRHYGNSESSGFRCAAAVLQKNEGHSYIQAVQQKLCIQTDSVCVKHLMKLQNAKQHYFNYDRCRSGIAKSFSICSLLILSSASANDTRFNLNVCFFML